MFMIGLSRHFSVVSSLPIAMREIDAGKKVLGVINEVKG